MLKALIAALVAAVALAVPAHAVSVDCTSQHGGKWAGFKCA